MFQKRFYNTDYYIDYLQMNPSIVKSSCRKAYKILRKYKVDTLIYRGTSGTQYAWVLSTMYGLNMIQVRKFGTTHAVGAEAVGYLKSKNVAFVDDFIATGRTRRVVFEAFEELKRTFNTNKGAKIVCSILLQDNENFTDDLGKIYGVL